MLPTEQPEDFPALRCSLTANSAPTATPGHAPARPGLVRMRTSVKLRQHAHVTCGLTQALIARPQRHAGGHDDARQECRIDSTEPPAPQPPLLDEVPDPLIVDVAKDHEALERLQEDRPVLEVPQRELGDDALVHAHLVELEQVDQDRLSFS